MRSVMAGATREGVQRGRAMSWYETVTNSGNQASVGVVNEIKILCSCSTKLKGIKRYQAE